MAKMVFEGKTYEGKSIQIVKDRIIVDGIDQGIVPNTPIEYSDNCTGSVLSLARILHKIVTCPKPRR
jgi:hypothetical protein